MGKDVQKELLSILKKGNFSLLGELLNKNGCIWVEKAKLRILRGPSNHPLNNLYIVFRERLENNCSDFILNSLEKSNIPENSLILFITPNKWKWKVLTGNNSNFEGFIETKKIKKTILASLCSKYPYGSTSIMLCFGSSSYLYNVCISLLKENYSSSKEVIGDPSSEWRLFFSKFYREDYLSQEVFIRHSYLVLFFKVILISHINERNNDNLPLSLTISNNNDMNGLSWFSWIMEDSFVSKMLFNAIEGLVFKKEDLFNQLYRDCIEVPIRKGLGEYYTPKNLAKLMIDETYDDKGIIVDPACGTGTFLIEWVIHAFQTTADPKRVLTNLHGFEINPLAGLVATTNLKLLLKSFNCLEVPVQVHILDFLFPYKIVEDTRNFKVIKNTEDNSLIKLGNEWFQKIFHSINEEVISKYVHFLKMANDVSEVNKWLKTQNTLEDTITADLLTIGKHFIQLPANGKALWPTVFFRWLGFKLNKHGITTLIGNPPWLVLNNINDPEYKKELKSLAKEFKILPKAEMITSLEVSSLFIYKGRRYLKNDGRIFFILSTGIISGAQHDKTRLFHDYSTLKFWTFDRDLFPVHSVCFSASKASGKLLEYPAEVIPISVKVSPDGIFALSRGTSLEYIPYSEELQKDGSVIARRLLPKDEVKKLIPRGSNDYFSKFFNGAALYPRALVFVDVLSINNDLAIIKPAKISQAKNPWNIEPFDTATIEKGSLYNVVKSTDLVPFRFIRTHTVFLPLDKKTWTFDKTLPKFASKHYELIREIYEQRQKHGQSLPDLWQNLDYQSKLTNSRQKAPIRVIFPQIGSTIKASLLRDPDVIVDCSLYLFVPFCEEEGYYLTAILNSPILTADLKLRGSLGARGSLRNIKKRPLEYLIPKYDPNSTLHKELVRIAIKMEEDINMLINKMKDDNKGIIRTSMIQREIFKRYKREFNELCSLVDSLLRNSKPK